MPVASRGWLLMARPCCPSCLHAHDMEAVACLMASRATLLMSAALHLPQGPVANWGFVIAVSSVGGVVFSLCHRW